ncbi:MAG: cadherin-like domain-containing protein [Bacteroidetes bacterium]|nr:cadherin-like domain-containing protein [Bacteroidota bacterium]
MSVSLFGSSKQGITATVNSNGSVNYAPPTDFVGVDTFSYMVCDNSIPSAKCDTALVIITMTNDSTAIPNIAPVAVDDYANTTIGKPVTVAVKINDSDPDGNALGIPAVISAPTYASSFVLNPSGTYTYTPDSSFNGNDTFMYSICDSGSPILCDTAMVVITIPCSPYTITGIDSLNPSTCLANDGRLTIKGLIPNVKYNINYNKDGLANTLVGQKSSSTGQIIMSGLTAGLYDNFSISIQFSSCPVTTPLSRKLVGPVPKYVGVKLNCK